MKILVSYFTLLFQTTMAQTYKYPVHHFEYQPGQTMAYIDEGPTDAPVLFMIHGLGGSIKHWYPTIEALSSAHRCIAIDLPGYGASTPYLLSENDLLNAFSQVIDQFISSLNLSEIVLTGHSMGGQIAIITTLKKPTWLKSLILAAPAGFETFSDKEKELLHSLTTPEVFQSQTEEQIRAAFALNFVKQPSWIEEMIQDRLDMRASEHFETYCKVRSEAVNGMLSHPVRDRLPLIDVPTLVLFGREDKLIPNTYLHPDLTVSKVAGGYQDIPNAKLHMLESAGHMLQIDNSTAFNEHLLTFIKN